MQGMENSFRYLCAQNYQRRTWFDWENKKGAVFMPQGVHCVSNIKKKQPLRLLPAITRSNMRQIHHFLNSPVKCGSVA